MERTLECDVVVVDHGYLFDPDGHDLAVLAEGIGHLRELALQPLCRLIGHELASSADSDLAETITRSHGHYFHPVGTCSMGSPTSCSG
jgi:choline dehydrogenase